MRDDRVNVGIKLAKQLQLLGERVGEKGSAGAIRVALETYRAHFGCPAVPRTDTVMSSPARLVSIREEDKQFLVDEAWRQRDLPGVEPSPIAVLAWAVTLALARTEFECINPQSGGSALAAALTKSEQRRKP